LSQNEANGVSGLNFAQADRDGNGTVSYQEAAPYL
jgi:hypothetical protein